VTQKCPDCHSQHLLPLGQGTQRSAQELENLFPSTQIIRVDRDSTITKQGFHEKLAQINEGNPSILLGTQMLAKGHHFPNVGLVVIMDADGGLFSADFRSMEKTAQLITQVAGRAGRGEVKGHVIIQTHQSDHPMLNDLVQLGYGNFARDLLIERQSFALPPFGYLALFRAESMFQSPGLEWLQQCKDLIVQYQAPLQIIGPIPAAMEKRAGKFRYQLLLKSNQRGALHQTLRHLMPLLEKIKGQHRLHWSLDIDPQDMT
jgi:primosomal protein N' (replication factor Y)